MWKIVAVEDEEPFIAAFREEVFEPLADRASVTQAPDLAAAREALRAEPADLVILDMAFPLEAGGRPDGRAGYKLLKELPELAPDARVAVVSGQDRRKAVELLVSRKVEAYFFKDLGLGEVRVHVEKILDTLDLERSNRLLRSGVDSPGGADLVAGAAAMQDVLKKAGQVAPRDTTVLVTGESGTGKEVMARWLHAHSDRAAGPFVPISCAALPEGLAEAELFGALKGSYTGIDADREGAMGAARGGTLFLDEIGELPLALQPKLLRALQERMYRPLGSATEKAADFRLVCATHRDLAKQVQEGDFRQDLFFRINVFPLELPPLRARLDDLPGLVAHLVARFNQRMGRRIGGVDDEAMKRLRAHTWPGNVRELANVIEYAFVVEEEEAIRPVSLPALMGAATASGDLYDLADHKEAMQLFERAYLERRLAANDLHVGNTAEAIGLPKRTLEDRMRRLGIRVRDMK